MDDRTLTETLEPFVNRGYPLTITADEAKAFLEGINRIMAAVPEDDRVFVRADYNLVTAALWHPKPTICDSIAD